MKKFILILSVIILSSCANTSKKPINPLPEEFLGEWEALSDAEILTIEQNEMIRRDRHRNYLLSGKAKFIKKIDKKIKLYGDRSPTLDQKPSDIYIFEVTYSPESEMQIKKSFISYQMYCDYNFLSTEPVLFLRYKSAPLLTWFTPEIASNTTYGITYSPKGISRDKKLTEQICGTKKEN